MLVVGRSELDDPSAAESGLDIAMIMAHMSLETLYDGIFQVSVDYCEIIK